MKLRRFEVSFRQHVLYPEGCMNRILVTSDGVGFREAAGIAAGAFGRGHPVFRLTLPGSVSDALQNPDTRARLAEQIAFLQTVRPIHSMAIVCNGDPDAAVKAMAPFLRGMVVHPLKRSLPDRQYTSMIVTCADYRLHLPGGLAAHLEDTALIHAISGFPRIREEGVFDWEELKEIVRASMRKSIREIHLVGHTDCGGYMGDDCALLRPDLNLATGVVAGEFHGTIHVHLAHVHPCGVSRLERVDSHHGHRPLHAHEGFDAPAA